MWSLLPFRISLFFLCAPGSSIPEPGYKAVFFWALMMPRVAWQKPAIEDAAGWGISAELWQKVWNSLLCLCLVPVVSERECKPTEWSLGPGMVWYQVLGILPFLDTHKMTYSYSYTFVVKHIFRKGTFIGRTSDIITKMTSKTISLMTENTASTQKPPHNPPNGPLFPSSVPTFLFLKISIGKWHCQNVNNIKVQCVCVLLVCGQLFPAIIFLSRVSLDNFSVVIHMLRCGTTVCFHTA